MLTFNSVLLPGFLPLFAGVFVPNHEMLFYGEEHSFCVFIYFLELIYRKAVDIMGGEVIFYGKKMLALFLIEC